jgi:hypothetical protein
VVAHGEGPALVVELETPGLPAPVPRYGLMPPSVATGTRDAG